jgi:tight adherence protein B
MSPEAALPLTLGLGAGGVTLLVALLAGGGDQRLERRLARAGRTAAADAPRAVSVRRAAQDSSIPLLDRLVKRLLPNKEALRRRLARTGRAISLGEYVLASAAVAGVVTLAALNLFGVALGISLPVGVTAGLLVPHLAVAAMGARRNSRFLDGFADAVDLMVRGLRSGLPVVESIVNVGRELPDPVGTEFARVADNVRMGRGLEDSMWEVAQRLDVPEFRFLIIAMSIQRETGGNLAETLSNLSGLLRRRRQMKLKIKAMSSEARASAWIIGLLPFLLFGILSVMNHDYAWTLLRDPRGLIMTGIGLTFIAVGALVMGKMVRFEI